MTPKIVDKEVKRAMILETAMKLFARKGVNATKMADIAAGAGIGKGTIYEYFPTKEAIFLAGFEQFYLEMQKALSAIAASSLSPPEKLEKLLFLSIDFLIKENPDFARVIMEFWAEGIRREENDEALTLNLKKIYAHYREIFADIIEAGIKQEMFHPLPPDTLASLLIGTLDGLYLQWFLDPESVDFEEAERILLDILYSGIKKNTEV
jgi:AcrR family transcriptional regulator